MTVPDSSVADRKLLVVTPCRTTSLRQETRARAQAVETTYLQQVAAVSDVWRSACAFTPAARRRAGRICRHERLAASAQLPVRK
jgi:hypothetical protein